MGCEFDNAFSNTIATVFLCTLPLSLELFPFWFVTDIRTLCYFVLTFVVCDGYKDTLLFCAYFCLEPACLVLPVT